MISPMMTFTKAGGVQSLPSVCSVVTTSPEPWAPFVLPNAASPGPASLYSVITYGIDRDGIASATLEIGTGYKTPALAGWDPNVLPGQLDDTVPDPVTHVNQIYVQGTHFTLSGDNITWISGPPDGTTLYVRWIYNTNNGQDGAAPRKGARVRTTVTNAKGTMPATPNAALDVAIPITDANNVPILDVLAINAVTSGPTTYTNGLDYYFDSGRRTDSIVQARLIWRGGGNRPIGNAVFTINLDYWASAGLSSGDYLAASSYAESDGRTLITDRPTLRQADANAWIGSPPDSVTNPNGFLSKLKLAVDIADAIDFRVGNRQPAIGGAMIVAYTYYLPRLDVVALDASGNIQLLLGASAAAPSLPTISPSVLPLLYISSDPASDCPKVRQAPSTVLSIPDLTNMMRRLENLETAALASELEQRGESASDNMIRRGIFSDPFQDFSRADTAFSVVANPSVPAEEGGGNVTFDCAIAPNAQVVRLPFDLQPTQLVVDRPGTSGVWVDGPQLALLTGDTSRSIVQEIRLHQLTPTRAQTINPGNALPPPMVVDLTPAFDFWVDVEQDPEQAVPLTDLGTRAQAPIGAQGAPVVDRGPAAGAAPLLKRRIHRWWNTYHSGQPQSKSDLPLEFAPASHSAIFVDGATGRSVPRAAAPNLAAPQGSAPVGFIDSAGRPRQQNSTQAIDTTVVSRDITPLMRQQPIAAHGSLFPPSREVRATFGGAPLALTPVSPTLAGLAPGTVTADVNGEFYATFTVPESSLVGSPQVTFISSVPRRAQGPRGASADQQLQYAGGATEWKAPEHVLDEDDASYSECLLPGGALSQVLMLNGFGFSIPTD
ncbi:MAG TPA: DUF4815 domain-containing protein, partial [Terriglobales bacterium]|nr:DUF4815 domain-containing protein [Terriglobales bacterium]